MIILIQAIPRSGSTWLLNTILCLIEAAGIPCKLMHIDTHIVKQSDPAKKIPVDPNNLRRAIQKTEKEGSGLVIRSHFLPQFLLDELSDVNPIVFITCRDPRDCVVSLLQQWKLHFEGACMSTGPACKQTLKTLDHFKVTRTFRYENDHINDIKTLTYLCDVLNLGVNEEVKHKIFEAFRPNGVIPNIGFFEAKKLYAFQPTGWALGHLGDGAVGKYKHVLTEEQTAIVVEQNQEYMKVFGYE